MSKCILKDINITESNDSKAHIIASALGGRLKPTGILSIIGNNELDRKVDNPHVQALQPYMTLLSGSRDRGGAPVSIQMVGQDGDRYKVGPCGIEPLDHAYHEYELDGKPAVSIKATSLKQAKELLGKAKKQFNLSENQVQELLLQAQTVRHYPGSLKVEIMAGPAVEFPSTFTMAALFCAHNGLPVHPNFITYIESFDENTVPRPLPPDTFYFIHREPWFKLHAEMGHCLILYADPIREQAIFFAQLFNMLGIAVVMPYGGKQPVCFTYGVDILMGRDVNVHCNEAALCALDWKETHKLGDLELFAMNQERGTALLKIAVEREYEHFSQEFDRSCSQIWAKHSSGKTTTGITLDERTALYNDLCDLIKQTLPPERIDSAIFGLSEKFEQLGGIKLG